MKNLYSAFLASNGVSTDTRTLEENQIFFALKGPNFNGNLHADKAIQKGASLVVVDEDVKTSEDSKVLLVSDVLVTLQKLARFHRDTFTFPVIGITGSNGKTTTKELIATALITKYNVSFTKGNLNNHIGVPLTILSIDTQYGYCNYRNGG